MRQRSVRITVGSKPGETFTNQHFRSIRFETDCKKGLPGRGLEFLRNVCVAVDIPVYGIGGIDPDNIALVRNAGAGGACMMSSLMLSEDVTGLLKYMEG